MQKFHCSSVFVCVYVSNVSFVQSEPVLRRISYFKKFITFYNNLTNYTTESSIFYIYSTRPMFLADTPDMEPLLLEFGYRRRISRKASSVAYGSIVSGSRYLAGKPVTTQVYLQK